MFCIGLALMSLAHAHPLGNNTVNRQAGLKLSPTAITLDYRLDIAEIPTLLATTDADTDNDGTTTKAEWADYAHAYGQRIQQGIVLRVNGEAVVLHLDSALASLKSGAAGLNTLFISARLSAPLQVHSGMKLTYQDIREPEQPGWKDVFFRAGYGLAVHASNVPVASSSRNLTAYPTSDLLNVLAATIEMGIIVPPENAAASQPESGAERAMRRVEPPVVKASQPTPPLTPPPVVSADARPTAIAPVAGPSPQPSAVPRATQPVSHAPRILPAWAFFRLGVHHIAIGWDHLMFLFGLILAQFSLRATSALHSSATPQWVAQPRLRRLIGVVTAFTVAHSLTLALAANGWVRLPGASVEAAIALTIAYVGLMNLLGRNRHSTQLAFGFGLVHGFGFAGALAASMGSQRTQGHDWLFNLAAFNLGIEAFQLILVMMLVPILGWISRQNRAEQVLRTLSFIVMIAGLGWFFSRI